MRRRGAPPAGIFGNWRLFTSDVEARADAYVLPGLITQVLDVFVCQRYPILKPHGKKCQNIHGNEVNGLAPRKKYYSL